MSATTCIRINASATNLQRKVTGVVVSSVVPATSAPLVSTVLAAIKPALVVLVLFAVVTEIVMMVSLEVVNVCATTQLSMVSGKVSIATLVKMVSTPSSAIKSASVLAMVPAPKVFTVTVLALAISGGTQLPVLLNVLLATRHSSSVAPML